MAENDPPPPPTPNLGGNPPPPPVVGKPVEEPPLPKTSYTDPPAAPVGEPEEIEAEEEEFVDEKVENKLLLILVHFVGLFGIPFWGFGNWILPLLLWLTKRNDTAGMEREGRSAVNFQVAMSVVTLIFFILGSLPFGEFASALAGFFVALVVIYNIGMSIWAVAMVNIGKPAPYPKIYDFIGKIIGSQQPEEQEEEPSDAA